jgi:ribose 5-phosphate isomerase B
MPKKLISERMVIDAASKGERILFYDTATLITAAARDRAKQLQIKIEPQPVAMLSPDQSSKGTVVTANESKIIAFGSDHGGFALKEILKQFIQTFGYTIIDVGTTGEEACDYPDFAFAVAKMVASGTASKGIMIDSVGVASAMVANKIKGIRAACCSDEFTARSSREHNNANVLTLGGKVLGTETAKALVKIWLETAYTGGRHQKRLDKIDEIEQRLLK